MLFLLPHPALAQDTDDAVIVVTGTRTPHPLEEALASTLVFTRADIEASGAQTLAELLEATPGVTVAPGYRGDVVTLRGLEPEHTLVLVDGRRLPGRVDGGLDLRRMTLADVEQVEIVKGPGSALYGSDAMGGVIHVTTRAPEAGLKADARAAVGTLPTADLSLGLDGGGARGRGRLSAELHHAGAVPAPDLPRTLFDATRQLDLHAQGAWTPGGLQLDASAGYLRQDDAGVDTNAAGAVFDRTTTTEQLSAAAGLGGTASRATWTVDGRWTLFHDIYAADQRGAKDGDAVQQTWAQLAELGAQADLSRGPHLLTVGVDGLAESLRSDRIDPDRARRLRGAPFAQDQWTLLERDDRRVLALAPAVRVDVDTRFGAAPSPRLALHSAPTEDLTLRLSGGRGFRAPDFKEQWLAFENTAAGYRVQGNPDLRPERSWGGDAELSWHPLDPLTLTASAYWTEIDDLITPTSVDVASGPLLFTYDNVAAARSRGVELGGAVALPAGLDLTLGWHLNDTLDREADRPLEGRARHQGTATAGWRWARTGLRATTRASLTSPRPYYLDDEVRYAPATALVDARLAWTSPAGPTLSLGVENLLGAGDAALNPVRPRELYAGLSGQLARQGDPR
ncbi:MAG: TonB-dependent receptor [Alphaproteobacteria bacterium]|nr:TonB-dependent receptor [Alphaproteobacteria bacterium]